MAVDVSDRAELVCSLAAFASGRVSWITPLNSRFHVAVITLMVMETKAGVNLMFPLASINLY